MTWGLPYVFILIGQIKSCLIWADFGIFEISRTTILAIVSKQTNFYLILSQRLSKTAKIFAIKLFYYNGNLKCQIHGKLADFKLPSNFCFYFFFVVTCVNRYLYLRVLRRNMTENITSRQQQRRKSGIKGVALSYFYPRRAHEEMKQETTNPASHEQQRKQCYNSGWFESKFYLVRF